MGHSLRSPFKSKKIRKTAMVALNEPTANEDGSVSSAMLQHYTNHHPLSASRLESHQVLTSVLKNLMGSVHETETDIHWPSETGNSITRQLLRVVDDANDCLEPDEDQDEEQCRVSLLGAYCRSEVPVRMFQITLCFARSWQDRTGIFDLDGLSEETILVDVDGMRMDNLPHAFRFYVDAIDEESFDDTDEDHVMWEAMHGAGSERVSVGRSVMERLMSQGMEARPEDFGSDRAWLEERRDRMTGVRLWSESARGERRLLLLGRRGMGLVYVGDLSG